MATYNNYATGFTRRGFKLGWYAVVGTTGLLLAAPVLARAESAWFDIAAQPLTAALRAFAAQAQMQLLYEHGAISGSSGNAVNGELDKKAALAQLLRNTGLEVVYSSAGAATIRPIGSDKHTEPTTRSESDKIGLAQAEQLASRRGSSENDWSPLEEVIVTARRREENLQKVPVAVTVVSQQTLQENNVQTMGDLQHLVPSMSSTTGLTRDALNIGIRGQGTNGISALPGVIAYINEVPIPTDKDGNLTGGPGFLFDLESVQVLKGPQGTLFGRNTTGGALLLQARRPTNAMGGRIQVTYGNHDNREVDGAINVPLVNDKLLARVAFTGQQRDGFTRLQGEPGHPNGIDTDNRDFWAARGSIAFRPSEWFENDTVLTYSKFDSNGSPVILTDLNPNGMAATVFPAYATFFAQQQALGIREAIPVNTHLESRGSNLAFNNISRFAVNDDLTIRNIFGYNEAKTIYQFDLDASLLPLSALPSTPREQTFRQYTDEVQLLGKSFDGRLDWIVGGFFLKHDPPKKYVLQTGTVFGLPFDSEYRQGDESKAIFAQGTYDLSAMLSGVKLTAGARYTWDDRFYDQRGGPVGARCVEPRVNCSVTTRRPSESSALTWTVGLDYQVLPATLLYLTSRRGYRAGGSNLATLDGDIVDFDPEFVTDVELGIKSDWQIADIPIRTNAALYYQRYRDIQVTQLVPNEGSFASITANAASARVWGAELEALVRLTDNLQVGASFDYFNFKYREFSPGVDAAQLEATRTVNRPPRKYGVSARYQLPVGTQVGDISVQVNWNWQDESGDVSQPGGMVDAFGLLNITLSWDEIVGKPVDATLFVSNLTDKVYTAGTLALYDTVGFSAQRYGEPRLYGVRLRYRFGEE